MSANSLTPARSGGFLEHAFEAPFHSLHREVNRLFDDVFHGRSATALQDSLEQYRPIMPKIDVSETDQEMRICAELPGVDGKDIDVSLDGDILTIRGEKKLEKRDENEKENYHLVERSYGTFVRALWLPYPVDTDKVRADFDNGVLTVTLPMIEQLEKRRRIPVQRDREPGLTLSQEPNSAQAKQPTQEAQQGGSPKKA